MRRPFNKLEGRVRILIFTTLIAAGALVAASKAFTDSSAVHLRWSDKGLASVEFAGHEYLSFGEFNLFRAKLVDSKGHSQPAPLQAVVNVDAKALTMTSVFSWSSIQTKVTAQGNLLEITIAITNKSPWDITELSFEPLRLTFDQKPGQYDGSIPLLADNVSSPGVVLLSTSDESLVLANEDPAKPLSIGFPWAINKPKSTEFPLRIVTGRDPMYPDSLPEIRRSILPGQTDVYTLSLRFGESHQDVNELALTVYRGLRRLYPSTMNWPDRRPIGAIMLATADAGFPGNPRGWFLDRSLDVSGQRGEARFREELMKWADTSIAILHRMKAQGAITWDIEGEQYAHPSTYVGDPRLIETLAPEMWPCVDEYFKRFRDAGLRVGITIRPQQFVRSADGRTAAQENFANPVQLLDDKIRFARQRWGANLFYVDSNGDPNYPMDWNVLRTVANDNPGVLLIPEHSSLLYYGFSAPYGELRRGVTASPGLARILYPGAFRVINTADGPVLDRFQELRAAVGGGDILMFRTWFHDPANDAILAITREAGSSR